MQFTLSWVSLVQMSANDHDNIGAEKRGSTEADPRHVRDINLVFIAIDLLLPDRKKTNSKRSYI